MVLRCETAPDGEDGLSAALGQALTEATKLRGVIEIVSPGSLPNDGKVIDDTRPVG